MDELLLPPHQLPRPLECEEEVEVGLEAGLDARELELPVEPELLLELELLLLLPPPHQLLDCQFPEPGFAQVEPPELLLELELLLLLLPLLPLPLLRPHDEPELLERLLEEEDEREKLLLRPPPELRPPPPEEPRGMIDTYC